MRARVVAQGATIIVLTVGTLAAQKYQVVDPADKVPEGMHPLEHEMLKTQAAVKVQAPPAQVEKNAEVPQDNKEV